MTAPCARDGALHVPEPRWRGPPTVLCPMPIECAISGDQMAEGGDEGRRSMCLYADFGHAPNPWIIT